MVRLSLRLSLSAVFAVVGLMSLPAGVSLANLATIDSSAQLSSTQPPSAQSPSEEFSAEGLQPTVETDGPLEDSDRSDEEVSTPVELTEEPLLFESAEPLPLTPSLIEMEPLLEMESILGNEVLIEKEEAETLVATRVPEPTTVGLLALGGLLATMVGARYRLG